jgi:hypothetical protein
MDLTSSGEPSFVVGPRPLTLSARIVGNMTESKKPSSTTPQTAAVPVPTTAMMVHSAAEAANNASSLEGATCFVIAEPANRCYFRNLGRRFFRGKALVAFLCREETDHLLCSLRFERFTPRTITQPGKFRKELEKIRWPGYARDDKEAEPGARCSRAIEGGKVAAAISVAGPAAKIARATVPALAKALVTATRAISEHVGTSESSVTDSRLP